MNHLFFVCLFQASTTDGDWLVALTDCLSQGGTLAKPESAAENTVVQGLLNGGVGNKQSETIL